MCLTDGGGECQDPKKILPFIAEAGGTCAYDQIPQLIQDSVLPAFSGKSDISWSSGVPFSFLS
jgi:hypothetical protein